MESIQPRGSEQDLRDLVRQTIREYHAQLFRRYSGAFVAFAALLLIIALVPSKSSSPTRTQTANGSGSASRTANAGAASGATGTVTTGAGGPTAGTGGPAGATGGPGDGVSATAGSPGVAKSGVSCGPEVRQVPWSKYAAICVPAFTGDNGGATSHGVSATDITVVYRTAAADPAPATGGATQAQTIADIQSFLDIFNASFETYGRKVVLKTFQGQGDTLVELSGQGQAQAEADAQTAHDMGAFAIADPLTSALYQNGLNARGVVSLAAGHNAQKAYDDNAPYRYGTPIWTTSQNDGHSIAALVCQRLANLPAIFAGDPVYQKTNRVFGMVDTEQPDYAGATAAFEQDAGQNCGVTLKAKPTYSIDTTTAAQQATPIVAQLKAAGVTTVLLDADPFMFSFMTNAASQQRYNPEWIFIQTGDSGGRLGDQAQVAHGIQIGAQGEAVPVAQQEAVAAMAANGKHAQAGGGIFGVSPIYYWMLQFFDAVQGAGPNLNPDTFRAGWASSPTSNGDYGLWKFDAAHPNPAADFTLSWWDPNATSADDGKAGAWKACEGGQRWEYPYPTNMGSGQLHCFGQ